MTLKLDDLKAEHERLKAEEADCERLVAEAEERRRRVSGRLGLVGDLIRFVEMYATGTVPEPVSY